MKINTTFKSQIIIQKGIIKNGKLPEGFIITDDNLKKHYKNLIIDENYSIIPGENSKSLETYNNILKEINDVNTIIAFGGGVVGDIAGFLASTYKRGINLIQIPTSLIAMTDSSIGGKNGVNLGNKKNYVGTIYQPSKIIIDVELLKTLPAIEFRNGLAEVIKYSYLFGTPSLDLITKKQHSDEEIENIIIECCKNKCRVIEKDPFDKGYRHILNFGHTIGHAIELLYNLSHGEAISIGMIKELEIAHKLGITKREDIEVLKKAFIAVNLPIELPKSFNQDDIMNILKSDKKGKYKFSFSETKYDIEVDEKTIKECLK